MFSKIKSSRSSPPPPLALLPLRNAEPQALQAAGVTRQDEMGQSWDQKEKRGFGGGLLLLADY